MSATESPAEQAMQATCEECGTRWTANEFVCCPKCQDLPIARDSADKILEDLACFAPGGNAQKRNKHSLSELADRAKALRGGK